MQRCRLPVDPRGTAVLQYLLIPEVLQYLLTSPVDPSARARIRFGIFDFPSENHIQIRGEEPAPLFENNIDIYI
jgi:hypothetical protein